MSSKEVEYYISSFPKEIQERLVYIRENLKKVFKEHEEKISYGMPTFKGKRNLFHYAAFKNHIGIFPTSAGIKEFEEEILKRGFKYSKGGFQISYKDELPMDLIREIAIWCRENLGK
ncbi:DUF1801 domain-containing protein [Lagierella sp.]|uniref:iron chaperone n=1 Tax=Lagierella sp. TaxID=2849657 RepID=UPI002620C4B8|nr:DUF1801 domain-containing protein [Lagierella sp.]